MKTLRTCGVINTGPYVILWRSLPRLTLSKTNQLTDIIAFWTTVKFKLSPSIGKTTLPVVAPIYHASQAILRQLLLHNEGKKLPNRPNYREI